ncbi:MAG: helix-turn-helix domain-containing protein [Treponema sp.]|nr:helix-turn-helix domain-containing protein [Treponema sp.]
MSKLNIIQRRELEPLMLKASSIIKHYEKAANCKASVTGPGTSNFNSICNRCKGETGKKCMNLHLDAVNKARQLGGSYIYLCEKNLVFWTSPFYSGERYAGAFLSGGMKKNDKNRVKSLAQMMLLCADQITKMSFLKKNTSQLKNVNPLFPPEKTVFEKQDVQNYACPLDMERKLLASLRRGDKAEGQKILVSILKLLYQNVKNNFPAFRMKALELAVLLTRATANPKDIMDNTALEATNRCIIKIEESSSFDEIKEILNDITERMSGMIFSFHGVRHFSAIRKAERYIWTHYTRKLSLKEIANVSGLSAPYFSTVFKEEMGENLSNYLNRLRVEKATTMLVTTDLPISEIAVACGFEDQSWFSKIFKNNTGYTPGKYREIGIHTGGMNAGNITA